MNTIRHKQSEDPMILCKSQEQLRDASAIIRKHRSDIDFIRDEMEVPSDGEVGLDVEALMDEYLEAVIMSSPGGSVLSQLSSPLQLGWRSEASDTEASPKLQEAQAATMKLSGWLLSLSIEESNDSGSSLEVSDCSTSDQRDEDYDADVSSNCDHSNTD